MSLRGEINKVSGEIGRSIRRMAQIEMTGRDGLIYGTKKILGYVCAIHEDGELAGTIDVQEFNYMPDEYALDGVGHHEGVLLSAIQNPESGFLIVPMLYSEVLIIQNPQDNREYVIMYSHARQIRLTATSLKDGDAGEIEIGVVERENFVETDDGVEKDCDELEETKNSALTRYTPTSITNQVTSPDSEEGFQQEITAEKKTIVIKNTKITIDGENVIIETSGKVSFKVGGTSISEEDGKVEIKTNDAKIDTTNCEIKGSNVKVDGASVTITGGNLKTQGVSSVDMNGPFNAIKVCPFSGAPHCGSTVTGT